jgi:putative membrane protein
MDSRQNYLKLFTLSLKGMAMGAADIVPGVSGGTIAFITGIYEELITSISNVNLEALRILRRKGIRNFWEYINGQFFVFLFLGIGLSIALLVKVVSYVLETYPVLIWSFFFGLILASIWVVGRAVKKWNLAAIIAMLTGTAFAFWISTIQTVANVDSNWYIFLSGSVAICAMILPGVSGSFILVLMGSYQVVISGLKNLDFTLIALFGSGCAIGLLSFARLLNFLFSRFKSITIALLTGFMIGSLNKVWPWKNRVGDSPLFKFEDKEEWATTNVLPMDYLNDDPKLLFAICLICVGLVLVLVLNKLAPKES